MRLILYPLTYQGDKRKQEAIERAVGLTESMQKQEDATYILSGLVAFSDKVINKDIAEKIRRRIGMTQVGTMIFNDGYAVGEEHNKKRNICAYIKDSICDGQAKERILSKLQCIFEVDELQAREFYDEIAGKVN